MDERAEQVLNELNRRYGPGPARCFRAPGRVNLLGEHTDYNEGFVLPIAIDRDVTFAARPRPDRTVRLYSLDFQQESSFSLDRIEKSTAETWSNYVRAIAQQLEQRGINLNGLDAVLQGNVPIASGLSSSAAMEIGSAVMFQALAGFKMSGVETALLAQKAEHDFIGVRVGIMDQYISRMGQKDHALLIDCRSLEYRSIPLPARTNTGQEYAFVVGDTKVRRELAGSEYNVRRQQCEEAVRLLQPVLPGITALRDVTAEALQKHASLLPPVVLQRARHVVTEDERVTRGVKALEAGDLAAFGGCMNGSHDSLRDDYAVSSVELDAIVSAARTVDGVLGSRMTGAGFGGCTVSLLEKRAVPEFERVVTDQFQAAFGRPPALYVCHAMEGAREISATPR